MDLHLRHRKDGNELRRLDDIHPVVPGKIGNDMRALIEAVAPDAERCIDILSRRVAAAKLEECVRIRALEPQLHRHVLAILL